MSVSTVKPKNENNLNDCNDYPNQSNTDCSPHHGQKKRNEAFGHLADVGEREQRI